jgi:endonuclease YncB( thermonuclease family)
VNSLRIAAYLGAVGGLAGLVTGFVTMPPREDTQAAAISAAQRSSDPIGALAARAVEQEQARQREAQRPAQPAQAPSPSPAAAPAGTGPERAVAWTTTPQRVEARPPTLPAQLPAGPAAPSPPAPEAPSGAAATRGSTVSDDFPAGTPAIYTRLEVTGAGAFRAVGRAFRFADVEALGAEDTCRDQRGATWPCGQRARAALAALVRQRSVHCVETGTDGATTVVRCRVGRTDLSAWLIEQGWARPPQGSNRFAGLAAEARRAGAGQFVTDAATVTAER